MLPDNFDEIFMTAYANVGLISDTVWITGVPDNFRRANQELWVQHNRVTNLYRNNSENSLCFFTPVREKVRTVRDTIPFSRLAQYGNYEYNEDRERLYAPDYISHVKEDLSLQDEQNLSDSCEEVWMFPEVEEEFKRLTYVDSSEHHKLWTQQLTPFTPPRQWIPDSEKSAPRQFLVFESWASILLTKYPKLANSVRNSQTRSLFSDDVSVLHRVEPFELRLFPASRYTLQTSEELQLQLRINSAEVRELWNRTTPTTQPNLLQDSQLHPQLPIHHRNTIRTQNPFDMSQSLVHRLPPPTLNADVPEFFPKTNIRPASIFSDDNENGRRYFPSAHGISHQSELFPYAPNNVKITSVTTENNIDFERPSFSIESTSSSPVRISTFATTGSADLHQSSSQLYSTQQHAPPSSSILCRPPQQWFSSNFQHHLSTLVYTHSQTAVPFISTTFSHETSTILNSQQTSVPKSIPVYQRPPEFYMQHQDPTMTNGNGSGSRRRQGGGGVDFSNLILLTRGGKSHQKMQNNIRQQQLCINQTKVDIPSTSDEYQPDHIIFGRDLFSDFPLRSVVHKQKELQNVNNVSCDTSPFLHISMDHQMLKPEERLENSDSEVSKTMITTTSLFPWLAYNYPDRSNDLQDVNNLINEFLSIETELQKQTENDKEQLETIQNTENSPIPLIMTERENFPPIVTMTLTNTVSPTISVEQSTPFQSSLSPSIPSENTLLISNPATEKIISASSDNNQPNVNVKRRLYRDVLTNRASGSVVTSLTMPVTDNCLDHRYDELERQALEQYRPSEENLGQRFQQQRTSEESISQRYQELERQAMEQYQSSSSSGSNDGCAAEVHQNSKSVSGDGVRDARVSGSVSSRDGAYVSEVSPVSQIAHCSGHEHCASVENSLLGDNQKLSLPSGDKGSMEASLEQNNISPNHLSTPGAETVCCTDGDNNNNDTNLGKREVMSLNSSHSQHELPTASTSAVSSETSTSFLTCITPKNATTKMRPAEASKSLPAIGSALSPVIVASKQVPTSLGAAGDKKGISMEAMSLTSRRRLVLITPTRKQCSLPSPPELTEEKTVGPQLLVMAPRPRGGCQSLGSDQTPRRLVAAIFDTRSQASRSPGCSTRADGARSSKSYTQQHHKNSGPMTIAMGGGGDEKLHQRNVKRMNPNVEWTQVSTKFHPQLANNNERDLCCSVACSSTMAKTASCLEISETWVHNHHQHCHEFTDSCSNGDSFPTKYAAGSQQPSPTKLPPWMTKQRKKRPTPTNKKKRNKSSVKRGICPSKTLNEVPLNCSLRLNQDDIEDTCDFTQNKSQKNYSVKTSTDNDNTYIYIPEKQNAMNICSDCFKSNEKVLKLLISTNQKDKGNTFVFTDNISKYSSETKPHSRLHFKNIINKEKKRTIDIESFEESSNLNSVYDEFLPKHGLNCGYGILEDEVKTIDHLIFQHLGNEGYNFRFQNNSLNPKCVIPHDVEIQIHPLRCMIDYFSNSEIEGVMLSEYNIHIKWVNFYINDRNENLEDKERVVNTYKLSAQVLRNASQLKMKQILKDSLILEIMMTFYKTLEEKTSINSICNRNQIIFDLNQKLEGMSGNEQKRCKHNNDNKLTVGNSNILSMKHQVSEISENKNKIMKTTDCKLKPQLTFQKCNPKSPMCAKYSSISQEIATVFNCAVNKVSCKARKLLFPSHKLQKSCSVPSVSSCNNYNSPELYLTPTFSHVQNADTLSARPVKKLVTKNSSYKYSEDNVLPNHSSMSNYYSTTSNCKLIQHSSDQISAVNMSVQQEKTLTKTRGQSPIPWISSGDFYINRTVEHDLIPSNEISLEIETKKNFLTTTIEQSEVSPEKSFVRLLADKSIPLPRHDNNLETTKEISSKRFTSLSVLDEISSTHSETLHINNNTIPGHFVSTEKSLPLIQGSDKSSQDLAASYQFTKNIVGSSATVQSSSIRQWKSKKSEELNSKFRNRKKQKTLCGLQ